MADLPTKSSPDAFVDVTIIQAGTMGIPDWALHLNGSKEFRHCPVYAFLIKHKQQNKAIFFDLGLHTVLKGAASVDVRITKFIRPMYRNCSRTTFCGCSLRNEILPRWPWKNVE
jgi:hypothetical protein